MKKFYLLSFIIASVAVTALSFTRGRDAALYESGYLDKLSSFRKDQEQLLRSIRDADIQKAGELEAVRTAINKARLSMKRMDFWFRYLEPTRYKLVNGPLPVEWETEVFEKFEKPYKRPGAGLTLATLYTEEENIQKDSLLSLVQSVLTATETYAADSITKHLKTHHHFFLCNRLFLLNLAAIYTTGFECPDVTRIVPELREMMLDVKDNYEVFNKSFPSTPVTSYYLTLYDKALQFVNDQPEDYEQFDHYTFIKDYVNPLFRINQQSITDYRVVSRNYVDYSLTKKSRSIFDKNIYNGQDVKGIFRRVDDEKVLAEIEEIGKLLFFDPILSGNNKRSCASCHKPNEYFTDTATATAFKFDRQGHLPRNTPSIINVEYNHLIMLDGKHISLQDQIRSVIANPDEMGGSETAMLKQIMDCPDYKKAFKKFLLLTPWEEEITGEHIVSAITLYYSRFSSYYSPFDKAMNGNLSPDPDVVKGFNVFMSKAQCGTCHFVPQFNGVKPPFVGSEFEVLGVPADTTFQRLSADSGRYGVNPAFETKNAFRTGSLRNAAFTAPYMHNGVFRTMKEVIDFYDAGGGAGRGLTVENQTLSSDSLHLTEVEKRQLIRFIESLNEDIVFEKAPTALPLSKNKKLNTRKPGGEY